MWKATFVCAVEIVYNPLIPIGHMERTMRRMHLHIFGRVQGVYFRLSSRKKAVDLGLVGWVRNCADGHVELVAEGDDSQLKILLQWCHDGPELANVVRIDEIWETATEALVGFDIRPTVR